MFLIQNNKEFEEDKVINIGVYYFYEDDPQFQDLKGIMKTENFY